MDAGAPGRGARGRGRARGDRAMGRGGRATGHGGQGRGRGLPADSAESAVPSVATASVTHTVSMAGEASVSADGGAGGGAAQGGGATPAQGRDDLMLGILTHILARISQAVPQQTPVAPPVAGAQQGAGFVGQHGAAVVGHPPYLQMMREMQRIGMPFFEGRVCPEEADEWRQRLEWNFRSIRCPEVYQVELAVHFLGGDAHLWRRYVEIRRAVWTWGDFLAEFNAKNFPQEARDRLQMRFIALSQEERSVREYDAEFSRLVVHTGFGLRGERPMLQRFLQGLRSSIKTQCRGGMYTTRAELVELTASIEEDLREQVGLMAVQAVVAPAT